MRAVDDTVGIQHRHDFEDDTFAKFNGDGRGACQNIKEPAHHPTRVGLAGVHAGGEEDDGPQSDDSGSSGEICDCQ